MHLLVVDDDPIAQRSVARVLEACGAVVVTADSVEAAVQIITGTRPFDAAIVDFQLVDQTGLTIISRLRSGDRPCCALMITGDIDQDRGVQAIAAGADDFLIKPFVAEELIGAVVKTVRQTRRWRSRLNGRPSAANVGTTDPLGLPQYDACVEELVRLGNLSSRERQVLEQVLLGKTNREAGKSVGLTERTVKYHMAGILRKFGVGSRNELMRLLFHRQHDGVVAPN